MKFIIYPCLLFGACLLSLSVQAQDRFTFDADLTYDNSIPAPADFLGYEAGERFTFHAYVMDYFEALAAASPKVTFHEYGETYEGRKLTYAVITSEANQARIDEIRQTSLRLADPADNEAASQIEAQPLVHWMSYNVHGNEPSSTEAAMHVAYRLAAAQDAQTQKFLDSLVVIIDPSINPDGRDRYAYWYSSVQSKHLNTNAEDLEHSEPWPGGRTNHYWFDLNRDWVWLVHPESRGRIQVYQQWLPQVHIDYHEQGFNNNYFTHPGTTPRNLNLPADYDKWAAAFGKGDADAFDADQISYFTRESFDFYYPGYGSSYPSLMGGIGMLREQGGHSRGGRAVKANDGYILTLRQRIHDHYLTSIAGMQTSVENREALLRYFRDAMTPAPNQPVQRRRGNRQETASNSARPPRPERAYILPDNENDYTQQLIWMMMEHGVEVHRADEAFTVADARDYWTARPTSRRFDAGTFIINTNQARHLFVNTIMQRQMAIEDSIMYDMATWSAPMAYNLDAAWTEQNLPVPATQLTTAPMKAGRVQNPNATYAYVIEWGQRHAPKALSLLWKEKYNVRSIQRPLHMEGKTFARGSLLVLMGRNRDKNATAAADMQRIAKEAGVEIYGYDSGWTEEGINPGSGKSRPVKQPKIALMMDSPFSSYTAGQLWFLLEEWTHLPINRIRMNDLGSIDLKTYDVIVLPGARGLSSELDSSKVGMLKAWIQAGGTLVGTEGSAQFLTKDQSGLTKVEMAKEKKDEKEEEEDDAFEPGSLEDPYVGLEDREDLSSLNNIPGSAIRSMLDTTHPLAYGMSKRLYSLKFGSAALEPSTSAEVVGYYHQQKDSVLASGYMSIKNREKLAGKAFAVNQDMGSGRVILLLDNTQYRMFWVGPARLMQNAVMLMPGM